MARIDIACTLLCVSGGGRRAARGGVCAPARCVVSREDGGKSFCCLMFRHVCSFEIISLRPIGRDFDLPCTPIPTVRIVLIPRQAAQFIMRRRLKDYDRARSQSQKF